MSSATLSKFTVPLDGSQPQGMLHPKLKYRFRVTFENFGAKGTATTELTKQVVSFARPTVQFEAIELPTYNSRIYVAGRHAWQTVATTLRDDATGQVSKLIGQQVQKQFDFFEMSSAAAGIDYKFMTRFQISFFTPIKKNGMKPVYLFWNASSTEKEGVLRKNGQTTAL
jgi:hypothetical protein